MPDFPAVTIGVPSGATIHTGHLSVSTAGQAEFAVLNYAAAAFPAANRAIYIPFTKDRIDTVKQMFWENGAVAGTTDVGIYDVYGNRLVSSGATTNAGTIQVVNITDTELPPGVYYMAILASTVTTQTYWSAAVNLNTLRACGLQQQAVGAATLPNPATFAAVASAYLPFVGISFQATM